MHVNTQQAHQKAATIPSSSDDDIKGIHIENAIKKMRNDGALGLNGLSAPTFKEAPQKWAEISLPLFNACNAKCHRSRFMEGSILCPEGTAKQLSPVALLDLEAKAFALVLLKQLDDWADKNNILPFFKTRFRSKASTGDNIMALAANEPPYTAATSTIDQDILWSKSAGWGLPTTSIALRDLAQGKNWDSKSYGQDLNIWRMEARVVLASLLFKLYCRFVKKTCKGLLTPKLGALRIFAMQYADKMILLDNSTIGLQRLMVGPHGFNKENMPTATKTK